jgi:hypothetical protein
MSGHHFISFSRTGYDSSLKTDDICTREASSSEAAGKSFGGSRHFSAYTLSYSRETEVFLSSAAPQYYPRPSECHSRRSLPRNFSAYLTPSIYAE